MIKYDDHPILGLLTLARSSENILNVRDEPDRLRASFKDSIVYDLGTFKELGRYATTHLAVLLRY